MPPALKLWQINRKIVFIQLTLAVILDRESNGPSFQNFTGTKVLLFVVLVSWEHYEHFFFSIHTDVAEYSRSIKNDHCHYTQQNIHFISVCTFSSSQMINCRGRTVANVKLKTIRMTFTAHNSVIFEVCKSESRYAVWVPPFTLE